MKRWIIKILVTSTLFLLVACATGIQDRDPTTPSNDQKTDTIPVVTKPNAGNVIAEGVVQPARHGRLGFELSGEVVEIHVDDGDRVEAGQTLVQLDTRELSIALQSARQDVIAQEAALQRLLKGASEKVIARADKSNADQVDQAKVALEAKKLQLAKAQAEDPTIAVDAAQTRVKQLELTRLQARAQDPAPAVTIAEVALERARIALDDTQDEYDKALDRPWEDQEIRDAWAKRLEQVQLDYRAAQAQLQEALNAQDAYQVRLDILSTQIAEAKTQLAQAIVSQETYSVTLETLKADIEAARLQLVALQTSDNPYRDEALPEDITQAQAALEKTRLGVQRIELQLEDSQLNAPFAGTVVDVLVELGDQVNPGQVIVVLAELDALEIHTTDLTELDVGRVAVGQPAVITVDAFPNLEFSGHVIQIGLQGQEYRGDTVYQAILTMDDLAETTPLRWGMTTMVEIVTD